MFNKINISVRDSEARDRQTEAIKSHTKAVEDLGARVSSLPQEIGDNYPKYTEKEMREVREQLEQAKHMIKILGKFDNAVVYAEPLMSSLEVAVTIALRDPYENQKNIELNDCTIRDGRLILKFDRTELEKGM